MAYDELGQIKSIQLGGVNTKTGKKNPTQLEGYYIGYEKRPNKFNPDKPKNFYKFQTAEGDVGIYASAGLDKVLESATLGVMTKIVATGETLDVGKGNPMKIFKAYQDKSNSIEVAQRQDAETPVTSDSDDSYVETAEAEAAFEEDESEPAPVVSARPVPPRTVPASINTSQQAKIQALLKSRSARN